MIAEDLPASLAAIESALDRLDRDVLLRLLQPGLPADHVRSKLHAAGLPSRPDLETLYGWRNGTADDQVSSLGQMWLLPIHYLLPLDDALETRTQYTAEFDRWPAGWLPILADDMGDYYVVDLESAGAPVRNFDNEDAEQPVVFSSLASMFAILAEAYERGIIRPDSEGDLDWNAAAFAELAMAMDPEADYWRTCS